MNRACLPENLLLCAAGETQGGECAIAAHNKVTPSLGLTRWRLEVLMDTFEVLFTDVDGEGDASIIGGMINTPGIKPTFPFAVLPPVNELPYITK